MILARISGGDSIPERVYYRSTVRIRPASDFSEFLSRIAFPKSGTGAFVPLRSGDAADALSPEGQDLILFIAGSELPWAAAAGAGEEQREAERVVRAAHSFLCPEESELIALILGCDAAAPAELVPELAAGEYRAFDCRAPGRKAGGLSAVLYFHGDLVRAFDALLAELGAKGLSRRLGEFLDAGQAKAGAAPQARKGEASSADPEREAAAAPPAESAAAAAELDIREPWAALGARLLFPAAVSAGSARLRFRPRSYAVLPGSLAAEDLPPASGEAGSRRWYRFAVQGGGTVNGFWALEAGEGLDGERLGTAADAAARSAAAALAGEYAAAGARGGPWTARCAPCAAPRLSAAPILRIRGDLDLAHFRLRADILVPAETPARLAALCGLATGRVAEGAAEAVASTAGAAPSEADGVLAAAMALDRRLAARPGALNLDALLSGDASRGTAFAPVHELLEFMSGEDRRRFVQNFLAPRLRGAELAALLFRPAGSAAAGAAGSTGAAGSAGAGADRPRVQRPQAFDLRAFAALLPAEARYAFAAALKDGAAVAAAAAAATAGDGDFLARNDRVDAEAAAELRRGSLALGVRGRGLLEEAYLRTVYPRRRGRLDRAIAADLPLAELASFTERQLRMTVDRSDAEALARAVLGRNPEETEERLTRIARFCSRRKLQAVRQEAERLARLLDSGALDPELLLSERLALGETARKVVEGEHREAERRRAARSAEEPGVRRYR